MPQLTDYNQAMLWLSTPTGNEITKSLKLALACMEEVRRRHHSLGLSGISQGALDKENEIMRAIEVINSIIPLTISK